ncbi:pyridoxine 5'-phosphate oxidase [Pedobacter antarcticus 4BY]|uniref:Pyridoxine/pyridoxamine 5'-phosphate oxidase n=2 Tax=Pedobacter antarcticus TaxID=34086 RepID=A0A081PD18_9SPHI|nr:pyridoxamine 5'-phosphate oxidase [Pedobacter antarcticus]KEQ28591.1 pyridoxine 5'-phosphate oxidase [Pedobacter antarcticus 4BY]SFE36509.1 Pyridoxamine 5'-phosphate oxidase [Pedobacter antarcticus]
MELTKENLQNLRQEYKAAELQESDVAANPTDQFANWFKDVLGAQLFEPNVMTLATADAMGKPSARIVLLKEFDNTGFVFYTNYESKKGKQLAENPQASLLFFWPELERQVRIDGIVSRVSAEASDSYFHSRPAGSQIGALASPQSQIIPNREYLQEKVSVLKNEFQGVEIPRPEHWGGYILEPQAMEFWQGRPSRLHDRINYTFDNGVWVISRLAP